MLSPYKTKGQIGRTLEKQGNREKTLKEELHGQPLVCKKTDEHVARGGKGSGRTQPETHAWSGPIDRAGRGGGHRCGHICVFGTWCSLCRAGSDALIRALWTGLRVCGAVLRGICRHDSASRQRLHLRLRH